MSVASRLFGLPKAAGAIAAVVAVAPSAVAATAEAARVTPAVTPARSAPFTIGVSDTVVKPGQRITISGLANARAGLKLTILSNAIASSRFVNGVPAVRTPALVEGIYRATVRIPPATAAGVYSVSLRFANRQVASITNLRVVGAGRNSGPVLTKGCAGISFTVLHNDYAGSAYLPAGSYVVSSAKLGCGTASQDFTSFLAGAGKPIPGWTTTSRGPGRATFTRLSGGVGFSVTRKS